MKGTRSIFSIFRLRPREDVAGAVAFLASGNAWFIAGATVLADERFSAARFMPAGQF